MLMGNLESVSTGQLWTEIASCAPRQPWANIEQSYDGFTHDPKGRRFKVALTYRFGG